MKVLFVCLGNICRSPMAHGILDDMIRSGKLKSENVEVDSCGLIDYHSGSPIDQRTTSVLKKHGVLKFEHYARKIKKSDFDEYDFIFCMDKSNLEELSKRTTKARLLGEYLKDPKQLIIKDPYYGSIEDFETVYEQCLKSITAFLQEQGLLE